MIVVFMLCDHQHAFRFVCMISSLYVIGFAGMQNQMFVDTEYFNQHEKP